VTITVIQHDYCQLRRVEKMIRLFRAFNYSRWQSHVRWCRALYTQRGWIAMTAAAHTSWIPNSVGRTKFVQFPRRSLREPSLVWISDKTANFRIESFRRRVSGYYSLAQKEKEVENTHRRKKEPTCNNSFAPLSLSQIRNKQYALGFDIMRE